MFIQIEFLLEGRVLPLTVKEFRISDFMLLEPVLSRSYEDIGYALMYVAISDEGNYFKRAMDCVDFFVVSCALIAGLPVTWKIGLRTNINSKADLGKKRCSFADFEKLNVLYEGAPEVDPYYEALLDVRKFFLEFLPDRQTIMESSLGIALSYYYFAVLASKRRLEEVVIDLTIAIEALLVTEGGNICNPLTRRLAVLISTDATEKSEITKKMRELYNLRSGIVHGRGKKPTRQETNKLFGYVSKALLKAISMRIYSKKELITRLDLESS